MQKRHPNKNSIMLTLLLYLSFVTPLFSQTVTDVRTIYTLDSSRYPKGVTLTSAIECNGMNHILIAWRCEKREGDWDQGDIWYSYSSNAGITWSSPALLAEQDETWQYVNIILYREGSVIYAYIGRSLASDNHGDSMMLTCKKSTDNGHSWTDQSITVNRSESMITGGRIIKYDGMYIMPYHYAEPRINPNPSMSTRYSAVMRSTDLITWDEGGKIPGSHDPFLAEGYLAPQMDNRDNILIMMRNCGDSYGGTIPGDGYAHYAVSADNGISWNKHVVATDLPSHNVKNFFARDSYNKYVYIYNTASNRQVLKYKINTPGMGWSAAYNWPDSTGRDEYIDGIEYEPGKFYCCWSRDLKKVMFAKLDTGGLSAPSSAQSCTDMNIHYVQNSNKPNITVTAPLWHGTVR